MAGNDKNFILTLEEDEVVYLMCCAKAMNKFLEGTNDDLFPERKRRRNMVKYLETRLEVRRNLANAIR